MKKRYFALLVVAVIVCTIFLQQSIAQAQKNEDKLIVTGLPDDSAELDKIAAADQEDVSSDVDVYVGVNADDDANGYEKITDDAGEDELKGDVGSNDINKFISLGKGINLFIHGNHEAEEKDLPMEQAAYCIAGMLIDEFGVDLNNAHVLMEYYTYPVNIEDSQNPDLNSDDTTYYEFNNLRSYWSGTFILSDYSIMYYGSIDSVTGEDFTWSYSPNDFSEDCIEGFTFLSIDGISTIDGVGDLDRKQRESDLLDYMRSVEHRLNDKSYEDAARRHMKTLSSKEVTSIKVKSNNFKDCSESMGSLRLYYCTDIVEVYVRLSDGTAYLLDIGAKTYELLHHNWTQDEEHAKDWETGSIWDIYL